MGKKIVLLAIAGVLVISAAAFAHGGWGSRGGMHYGAWGNQALCPGPGYGYGSGYGPGMMWADPDDGSWQGFRQRSFGPRQGYGSDGRVEFPAEITEKMRGLQRTHLEIRLALTEGTPDVQKARQLFERSQELRNELARWRFERYLENLEKTG